MRSLPVVERKGFLTMPRTILAVKYRKRIQALVDALRSKKYKQTTRALRDKNGYCCLGVACDVYRKRVRKGKWKRFKFLDCGHYLSQIVQEYYGFPDANPVLRIDEKSDFAAHFNDEGATFEDIASGFEDKFLR